MCENNKMGLAIIERSWAMPSHETFSILPIKKLIAEELGNDFVDPFPYPFKRDALEFLKEFPTESVQNLAFDPPYSVRQLKEKYQQAGLSYETRPTYWKNLKAEISRIMKPNGTVISFGWNSGGIGITLGFKIKRILLVAHGGIHNDTICTVEKKIQSRLQ